MIRKLLTCASDERRRSKISPWIDVVADEVMWGPVRSITGRDGLTYLKTVPYDPSMHKFDAVDWPLSTASSSPGIPLGELFATERAPERRFEVCCVVDASKSMWFPDLKRATASDMVWLFAEMAFSSHTSFRLIEWLPEEFAGSKEGVRERHLIFDSGCVEGYADLDAFIANPQIGECRRGSISADLAELHSRNTIFVFITDMGIAITEKMLKSVFVGLESETNNNAPILVALDEWTGYEPTLGAMSISDAQGWSALWGWWGQRRAIALEIAQRKQRFARVAQIMRQCDVQFVQIPFLSDPGAVLDRHLQIHSSI
jgi:hypothetical protein